MSETKQFMNNNMNMNMNNMRPNFGKPLIWVHLTPYIFNDQITNFIMQIYLLMALSPSRCLEL